MPRIKHWIEYERQLLANIAKHGWHCTSVFGEEDTPSFSYTIGLFRSYAYPELLVFGLPPRTAHGAFSIAASAAARGKPFALDQATHRLFRGFPAVFVRVPAAEYRNYVLSDVWYYRGTAFPLYQIVWPFEDGTFPWHASVSEQQRRSQPVLGLHAVS